MTYLDLTEKNAAAAVARRSLLSKNHDGGPVPDADSLLLVSERVRMDLIKSLSFPPTFLRWRGAHGSSGGMVVVPPPVIAFDWLLPGVAHIVWFGSKMFRKCTCSDFQNFFFPGSVWYWRIEISDKT